MGLDGLLRQRAGVLTGILQRHRRRRCGIRRPTRISPRASTPTHLARRAREQGGAAGALRPRRRAGGASLFGVVSRLTLAEGHGPPARRAAGARRPRRAARAAGLGRQGARSTASPRPRARIPGRVAARDRLRRGARASGAGAAPTRCSCRRASSPAASPSSARCATARFPIVARVGGLADTVVDANEMALAAGAGTGIQFAPVTREQSRVRDRPRRCAAARPPRRGGGMQSRAMATDVGWTRPAQQLRRALPRARGARARPDRCADVGPGSPEPLGVTPGARRRERRRLLRARDRDRALPLRRERRARDRAHRAAGAHRRRLPRLRRRRRGRRSLRPAGARPVRPARGSPLQSAKLLVDPYARALDRPFAYDPALFGGGDDRGDARRHRQRAVRAQGHRDAARRRRRPRRGRACRGRETILYELHVRGFTRAHPGVPEALRGTCAGLAHPAALAHLTRLGITTVELMPIAAAIDERHLARARPHQLLGLQPGRAVRPRSAARAGRHRRAARLRGRAARGRHRGDPRRRPQPHRRRRRARADAVAARPRQRDLLPDARRRSRPLRRRHRLRQHARARPGAGAAPRAGRAALLRARRRASTASASTSRRRSAAATTASIRRRRCCRRSRRIPCCATSS